MAASQKKGYNYVRLPIYDMLDHNSGVSLADSMPKNFQTVFLPSRGGLEPARFLIAGGETSRGSSARVFSYSEDRGRLSEEQSMYQSRKQFSMIAAKPDLAVVIGGIKQQDTH